MSLGAWPWAWAPCELGTWAGSQAWAPGPTAEHLPQTWSLGLGLGYAQSMGNGAWSTQHSLNWRTHHTCLSLEHGDLNMEPETQSLAPATDTARTERRTWLAERACTEPGTERGLALYLA
jgi:hypothetical protein